MVPPVPNPAQNPSIGVSISPQDLLRPYLFRAQRDYRRSRTAEGCRPRVVFGHFVSERDAARDAFADIAFVVHHDDFRTVLSDELMAFVRDRIGHDQHRLVALHRTDERESNALVATGGLNDDGIRTDDPLRFGSFDHLERSARLDRTATFNPSYFTTMRAWSGVVIWLSSISGDMPSASKIVR